MERPAQVTEIEPGLIRVLADNPSPMTYWGTNTFILGTGAERILIDPGPDDPAHLTAILMALPKGTQISQILVTHAHRDHSELAPRLSQVTGAPVLAFGTATAGRTPVMQRLADEGLIAGGEGMDAAFSPDVCITHGQVIEVGGVQLTALHTPGHFAGHLSFDWQGRIFTGDLIMGWASSLVSPPDGDLGQFMSSLDLIEACAPKRLYPAHGAEISEPIRRVQWLRAHRQERHAQIRDALQSGPQTLTRLTQTLYAETPPALHPAAARNILAHLIELYAKNEIFASPRLSPDAEFSLRK